MTAVRHGHDMWVLHDLLSIRLDQIGQNGHETCIHLYFTHNTATGLACCRLSIVDVSSLSQFVAS